jgi:hypothetical protein
MVAALAAALTARDERALWATIGEGRPDLGSPREERAG